MLVGLLGNQLFGVLTDSKKSQLHVECAVAHFPKGEAAEQGCKNVQDDLIPHVILQN